MKILKRQISSKDGSGLVVLRPEIDEDMWHAYNLLQEGDMVRCTTLRKVVKESSTGSTSSQKKRMQLTIQIQKVEFDPKSLQVRLSGPTAAESNHVKMGAFHTLTLEPNQNFSLEKECWDQILLDRLEEAANPAQQAEVAAVVMQATGLAHVCLITGSLTLTQAKIDVNIPKKRTNYASQHTKAIQKFYNAVYTQGILKLPLRQLKVCLVGSPGYVKDDFHQFMMQQSVRNDDRLIIENKHKFVLCKAASGHKHAISELLADPKILAQLEDTKVAKEVATLEQFFQLISNDPDRAYYSYPSVQKAQEQLAIDTLLVTDKLFRANTVQTRRKYVKLVEDVRNSGGKVFVFSTMHVSGQQLHQVGGVAAILRYPLPEIEDEVEDDDDDEDDDYESTDDEFDPDKRIQEDMVDMGF